MRGVDMFHLPPKSAPIESGSLDGVHHTAAPLPSGPVRLRQHESCRSMNPRSSQGITGAVRQPFDTPRRIHERAERIALLLLVHETGYRDEIDADLAPSVSAPLLPSARACVT